MTMIADGLLMATATIAGIYCLVLSRRLRRLTDSSSGIGSQIAALDRALAETRGALIETREGVSEIRASARAAIAELKRRTGSAEAAASSLAEATDRAESVLQRLYEAHERVVTLDDHAADAGEGPSRTDQAGNGAPPRRPIVLDVEGGNGNPDADGEPAGVVSAGRPQGGRDGKRKGGGLET